MVQPQPFEPGDPVRPSVDEILRAGKELLDQSRRLSDALDAQLLRHGAVDDVEPLPDGSPVETV